jgi:DNA-binding PadR family transcriptional regulator
MTDSHRPDKSVDPTTDGHPRGGPEACPDGGQALVRPEIDPDDLSLFRIDLLWGIARAEDETSAPTGADIIQELEPEYGHAKVQTRAYKDLGTLADLGLIEKSPRVDSKRANAYRLTEAGVAVLRRRGERLLNGAYEARGDSDGDDDYEREQESDA